MGRSTRMAVAQAGELFDILRGGITGAELVAVLPDKRRVAVVGASYEPTVQHPRGRLVLELDDRPHYSSPILAEREVAGRGCADPARGRAGDGMGPSKRTFVVIVTTDDPGAEFAVRDAAEQLACAIGWAGTSTTSIEAIETFDDRDPACLAEYEMEPSG